MPTRFFQRWPLPALQGATVPVTDASPAAVRAFLRWIQLPVEDGPQRLQLLVLRGARPLRGTPSTLVIPHIS